MSEDMRGLVYIIALYSVIRFMYDIIMQIAQMIY